MAVVVLVAPIGWSVVGLLTSGGGAPEAGPAVAASAAGAVEGVPPRSAVTGAEPGGTDGSPPAGAPVSCTHSGNAGPVPCSAWVAQVGGPPTTGPAVAGGTVAVGRRADVVGLDAGTGEVRWRTEVRGAQGLAAYRDGTGFVVWTAEGAVVALAGDDGRVVWRAPERAPVDDAASEQGWVLAAGRSGVRAWSLHDPAAAWVVTVSGQPSALAVGDGVVAVGDGQGEVRLVDVDTGRTRWSAPAGTWHTAITGDGALVLTAGYDAALQALDAGTGGTAWASPTVRGWGAPYPLGDGRGVVQGEGDGVLVVFDAGTGEVVAEEPLLGRGRLLGTTADGWVLLYGNGRLQAYDGVRADGTIGWTVLLDGEPVGATAVAHPGPGDAPMLVVGTSDGRVVAVPVPPRVP